MWTFPPRASPVTIAALSCSLSCVSAWAFAGDEPGLQGAVDTGDLLPERTVDIPRAGPMDGGVRAVAFSADGSLVAAGAPDGSVLSFSAAPPAPGAGLEGAITIHRHAGAVAGVAVIDMGGGLSLVASAGDDGILALTDPAAKPTTSGGTQGAKGSAKGAAPAPALPRSVTITTGLGPITALALLHAEGPEGSARQVVLGAASGALGLVAITPASSGGGALCEARLERTIPAAHEGPVTGLAGLPKGRVVSVGFDGKVRLTETASGKEAKAFKASKLELAAVAASIDGKTVAICGYESGLRLLDAASLKPVGAPVPAHKGAGTALALGRGAADAAGALIVSASLADESVAITGAAGRDKKQLAVALRGRPAGIPACLALSPDGRRLAVGTFAGTVALYRLDAVWKTRGAS